ncbi:MAG: Hachiman antiphage defense system protein HamA [Pseudomonadota bacterium]
MQELGLDIEQVLQWFPHEIETPYVLIRVSADHANGWPIALCDAVRRCYLKDELLINRTQELKEEFSGTPESRQLKVINSKLPPSGSTMSGDFGEILFYIYQAARAHPQTAVGPKKWRLKHDRTKPAPGSDVVHFILPTWPTPSAQDEILCAEVKAKATDGISSPIEEAIKDCAKDRISRLSRTLQWLKARAIGESLGAVQISHLDRFINATDYPSAIKRFRAVAVICSNLLDSELVKAPAQALTEYSLFVVAVPNLRAVYTAVFSAASASILPNGQVK